MSRRPRPIDLTAGVLVVAAVLVWSVWGTREFRHRASAGSSARAVPATLSPLSAQRKHGRDPEEPLPEILDSIRSSERQPGDPAPIARLESVRVAPAADALLDLASASHSKDVRLESLRLLGDRGYSEDQIRKAAALFRVEIDEDIRMAILLGVTKSAGPGAEAMARQGTADVSETIRSVALAALDPENEGHRRLLTGLALSDPSDLVRANATLILHERSGDPGVLDTILTVSRQDACDENRKHAIRLLGGDALRGDGRVLEALQWSATRDPSPDVRNEAQTLFEAAKKGN